MNIINHLFLFFNFCSVKIIPSNTILKIIYDSLKSPLLFINSMFLIIIDFFIAL